MSGSTPLNPSHNRFIIVFRDVGHYTFSGLYIAEWVSDSLVFTFGIENVPCNVLSHQNDPLAIRWNSKRGCSWIKSSHCCYHVCVCVCVCVCAWVYVCVCVCLDWTPNQCHFPNIKGPHQNINQCSGRFLRGRHCVPLVEERTGCTRSTNQRTERTERTRRNYRRWRDRDGGDRHQTRQRYRCSIISDTEWLVY